MLHKPQNPVVVLGRGDISVALTIRVQRITKSAREKIEAAGGSVEIIAG
jgi:large subunit ribosomal protein L15